MKIATKLLACAALSASLVAANQVAEAAAPKIKGKYAFHSIDICKIGITITKDLQGDMVNVNAHGSNHIATIVGTITFTGPAANSGNLSLTQQTIEGLPFFVGNAPGVFAQTAGSGSNTYSNTATTLTLHGDTGPAAYGNIVNGIAKTVKFIARHNGGRCFESGTLTREN